jgi:cell division protein FtsI/penicillin-binding protein 2
MQQLTRSRTGLLAIILLGAMAIFVVRLFQLQIIQHGEYVARAKSYQQRSFVMPATRGEIYMMDGKTAVPVVLNQTVYTMIADPQAVKSSEREKIVSSLREIAGGEMLESVEARLANEKSRYEVLARNLTRTQAEVLKKKDFSGILYQQGSVRSYPEGKLGAHVLGFVNAEGQGQYGVEGGLNERLKGADGMLRSVTDVRNVPLTVGKDNIRVEPKSGENVVLTIDRNIQSFTEEALQAGVDKAGATEGSVLVMNPNTGQVLAMANYPTYDPAQYGKVQDPSIFMNPTTMGAAEQGSIIKTFLIATGLDKGAITPSSTYMNTDCIEVADRTMCNALRGLGGVTDIQGILTNSLNVGTITVGRRLGNGSQINLSARQAMYEYYHDKFGLGEKTGIEVNEDNGHIYTPDTAEGNEVRYSTMTFGQGMTLTMIQVAAGFCSVVNGGQYFQPTVVDGVMDKTGVLTPSQHTSLRQTVSAEVSSQMREMLHVARSTTWLGREDRAGYMIGGKTGTSETVRDGAYTQSETEATYIGYGGVDHPEYVIMVRVAAPGKGLNLEGGLHAGPIFTDVSNRMIDYMKLAPRN